MQRLCQQSRPSVELLQVNAEASTTLCLELNEVV